jgi:hypothetical protein
MKTHYKIVIIGCGTSAGFLLSFLADRPDDKKLGILILEKTSKVFRKLRASGNGRCNYSNLDITENQYYSSTATKEWRQKAVQYTNKLDLKKYFLKKGIPSTSDIYKRLFPHTNSAATITGYFEDVLEKSGAELILNSEVVDIKFDKISETYHVFWSLSGNTTRQSVSAEKVVFAAGGAAYPQLGTDGTAFKLLKQLGHLITPLLPGIVPLETSHQVFNKLNGMKIETEITFKDFRRSGELLFTDYGISGPNVLYASNIISMNVLSGPLQIHVNFLPGKELSFDYFRSLWERSYSKTFIDIFKGALQIEFLHTFIKHIPNGATRFSGKLSYMQLKELYNLLTNCPIQVTRTKSFKDAQITLGGVHCNEVNPDTFKSCLKKNLFILGEAIDFTGNCGGYNIHWCATTALAAASCI